MLSSPSLSKTVNGSCFWLKSSIAETLTFGIGPWHTNLMGFHWIVCLNFPRIQRPDTCTRTFFWCLRPAYHKKDGGDGYSNPNVWNLPHLLYTVACFPRDQNHFPEPPSTFSWSDSNLGLNRAKLPLPYYYSEVVFHGNISQCGHCNSCDVWSTS